MNNATKVSYIAGPEASADQARQAAQALNLTEPVLLKRRGTALGWIAAQTNTATGDATTAGTAWQASQGYALHGYVSEQLDTHANHIKQSLQLMADVAQGGDVADLLDAPPYNERTTPRFEMMAAFQDEGDDQEIETLEYDAIDGENVIGENLWCKASWLSFEDDDASLRFRFSFGMAGYEDVAADPQRQRLAGELTDALFPESEIISRNANLEAFLNQALGSNSLAYVERIIYFNAPNGGAQFHQDVERGHLGVVFAQVHGRTGWLACAKTELIDEVQTFVSADENLETLTALMEPQMLSELKQKSADRATLNVWLDERDNEPLERLLNRCPEFYKHMFDQGYGYIINSGDIILLPQKSLDECCWHTVFCLDDFPGESLSFAVREM